METTNSTELKAYVGIILYGGVVWKPTFSYYYATNATFSTLCYLKFYRTID